MAHTCASHLTYYFAVVIRLLMVLLFSICQGTVDAGELEQKSNCICPGFTLTFAECTVKGGPGDSTVWKGSAFDCIHSGNKIDLIHSLFGSSIDSSTSTAAVAAGECNNGSIRAKGVRVEGNCYTSQLNITVTANMIGKTIDCGHDNASDSTESVIIGTLTVAIEDPLSPPNTLFISKADFVSRQVTFNWSRAVTECPDRAIHYNILASNCGSCPTTTNHTSVTCINVQTNVSTCTFAVQAVVCGFIAGNISENISLNLSPFQTMMTLRPTYDFLPVLIAGIVLLIITAIFVVCLLIFSKFRKKFKSTARETCNSNKMEDNCLSSTTIKIFDNEKMGMYGFDDNIDNENSETIPNNIVTGHPPDLNSLLQHLLQGQVALKWYRFGLALGVPQEILNQLTDYSEEDSLVELLDYWLKHHPNQPTWQEVSNAQDKININQTTGTGT